MSDVTRILSQIESGDPSAAEQLLPLVYDELRKLAADRLAREKPGQTLQATALVHEAYLRLVDNERAQHWDSRGHFFAAASFRNSSYTSGNSCSAADGSPDSICDRMRVTSDMDCSPRANRGSALSILLSAAAIHRTDSSASSSDSNRLRNGRDPISGQIAPCVH